MPSACPCPSSWPPRGWHWTAGSRWPGGGPGSQILLRAQLGVSAGIEGGGAVRGVGGRDCPSHPLHPLSPRSWCRSRWRWGPVACPRPGGTLPPIPRRRRGRSAGRGGCASACSRLTGRAGGGAIPPPPPPQGASSPLPRLHPAPIPASARAINPKPGWGGSGHEPPGPSPPTRGPGWGGH